MKGALRNAVKIALVVVIGAAFVALWLSPLRSHLNRHEILAAIGSVRDVWYGPIAFIAVYAAGCVVAIPATVFIVCSGVIWGWGFGGIYALAGGLCGATLSYLIGYFLGEGVLVRFGKLGRAVEKRVEKAGFKSFLILRLIPLFPFAVLNYGAGVARLRYRWFLLATLIALAPGTFVFAYSADALFNGTLTEGEAVGRLAIAAGLLLAIVVLPGLLKKWLSPSTAQGGA